MLMLAPGVHGDLVMLAPGACRDMAIWLCCCLERALRSLCVYLNAPRMQQTCQFTAWDNLCFQTQESLKKGSRKVSMPDRAQNPKKWKSVALHTGQHNSGRPH
eukprot:scaffold138460_cov24-Tisochrysis_lutea.AAC.2